LLLWQVCCEGLVELRRIDCELDGGTAGGRVLVRDQSAAEDGVLRRRGDLAEALTLVRSERRHEDEADDVFGMSRGRRDHRAGVRVPDGDDPARRFPQHAGDVRRIVRKPTQRVRGSGHGHALVLQSFDHGVPARAVGERSVDQHDGRKATLGGCLRH
jgi:hypothetical protein